MRMPWYAQKNKRHQFQLSYHRPVMDSLSHQSAAHYLVIGGGLVGLATARALLLKHPGARVLVLEKEAGCGQHQSTHNSGVLHCGLYYKPGSLKARLAVEGIREMVAYCREHAIPHEQCGKVVVATNEEERARLAELEARGTANGLQGLRRMGPEELAEREPWARGIAALLVPEEGIVDFRAVVATLQHEIVERGGTIQCSARVLRLSRADGDWLAETTAGEYRGMKLVNCAGLYSDQIAKLAGLRPETRIVPFRGEYYLLKPDARVRVNHLIYPVPHPAFPFLGAHFTRRMEGGVEAGPNAVLAMAREGYSRWRVHPAEWAATMKFVGLWRFVARHPRLCLAEWAQTWRPSLFVEALQHLVPEIQRADLQSGGAGVRAQAMTREGRLEQDFLIMRKEDALHVLNAPSPAATASLAIGRFIAGQAD